MIRAFLGANGSGKTLTMVHKMALPALLKGNAVVSNFTVRPEVVDRDPAQWVPLTTWRLIPRIGVQCRACYRASQGLWLKPAYAAHVAEQEIDVDELDVVEGNVGCELARWSATGNRPATLLLTEISAALPSRGAMDLPAELARMLHQFRKPMVHVGWDGVNWARCDKILREATGYVTLSRGRFPDRYERDDAGKPAKDARGHRIRSTDEWGANRLFRLEHFDAMEFEEFNLDQAVQDEGGLKPLKREWFWRPGKPAGRLYDTEEQVLLLDNVDASGICANCEGARRRHVCKCGDDGASSAAAKFVRRPELEAAA